MSENVTPELRPNQVKAAAVLATTGRISEAAAAAGVSRKTIWQWLKQPEFKAQLNEAARAALDDLARVLAVGSYDAAAVLRSIMDNAHQPGAVRVKAAIAWLSALSSLHQIFEFEKRLAALEEKTK